MLSVPILCLALVCLLPSVLPSTEPGLTAPRNVRMDSYNMKHVVRWDAVEVEDGLGPVMYSVEFEMYSKPIQLCVNITETECNCTEKILSIFRGKVLVHAELGSRRSNWVVLPDFQPSKNTTIGPVKSLVLQPHSGKLTVDFSPPFSPIPNNWVMEYNLSYWKESSEKKETVYLHSATSYVLDNLEPDTNYCVQVYAFTHYIKGLASDPVCDKVVTDVTQIVVLGCVFGFVLICVVIGLLIIPDRPLHLAWARIKNWLDGPYRIPSDIMEYLEDLPNSGPMECTQDTRQEEQYDKVSIVQMDSGQDVPVEMRPDPSQLASEKT